MDSRLSAGLLGSVNSNSPLDSGAFTDLNRLNQFKLGGDSEKNIRKVAQEFESLFLNEMLKAMRSANEVFAEGNFMNSNESKTYQDMHDQQLSVTLSNNQNGIGLADVLGREMSKIKDASSRPNPFAQGDQPGPGAGPDGAGSGQGGVRLEGRVHRRHAADGRAGRREDRRRCPLPGGPGRAGNRLGQVDHSPAGRHQQPQPVRHQEPQQLGRRVGTGADYRIPGR